MSRLRTQRRKAFTRWAALADSEMESALLCAVDTLASVPLAAGFEYVEKAFDSIGVPPFAVSVERSPTFGVTDYICFGFDKRHRARFQIYFGSKETAHPHRWIRAGALVWKNGSELDQYKWWGAKWWQPNKVASFKKAVEQVAQLMPQVVHYLSTGLAGPDIFSEKIPQRTERTGSE